MPPMTIGVPGYVAWTRFVYTMVARSGRRGTPPGEYTSELRRFRLGVRLLTIESTLPEEMPKKSRGLPRAVKSRSVFTSGWAMMPTENPASQRTRPMSAVPNEG